MRWIVGLLFFAALQPAAAAEILAPDRWLKHLNDDLLPFWTHPDAAGDGTGLYPSMRCNDGRAVDPTAPCAEIAQWPWLKPNEHWTVALSRQAYAYGVAFHLTGDPDHLAKMRRGVDLLLGPARNRDRGGHYQRFDASVGLWTGPQMTLQEQSYALLAPAFYFYLTRDGQVLKALEALRHEIMATYRQPQTGAYAVKAGGTPGMRHLVSYIDQINAFYLLMAPLVEGESGADWMAEMARIARATEVHFYAQSQNAFHRKVTEGQGPSPDIDLGYSLKTFWFLQMAASASGEAAWAEALGQRARQLLKRAQDPEIGAWRDGLDAQGRFWPSISSWKFAEQNQLAAALSIADPSLRQMLRRSHAFWLDHFVDPALGEVFDKLDASGRPPAESPPKHWPWKAGFHTSEHALVAYIAGGGITGQPITLHYAFDEPPRVLQPYFFTAEIQDLSTVGPVTSVTFTKISYAGERSPL